MNFTQRRFACAVSAMAMVIAAPVYTATAHGLEIESAWTPGPAAQTESRVAYVTIVNEAFHPEYLHGASTPLAERVELHKSTGPGEMLKVDRVEIPLSDSLDMHRAGYHLMLIGLKRALKAGDRIPVILTFSEGRTEASFISVSAQNTGPDGPGPAPAKK